MTLLEIEAYCLAKTGAYLDFPFGPDAKIIKVKAPSQEKGRILAQLFKFLANCRKSTKKSWGALTTDESTRPQPLLDHHGHIIAHRKIILGIQVLHKRAFGFECSRANHPGVVII